jgi:hypothetical protein
MAEFSTKKVPGGYKGVCKKLYLPNTRTYEGFHTSAVYPTRADALRAAKGEARDILKETHFHANPRSRIMVRRARRNPLKGAFSGTGRPGETYAVGTLGKGTAHFIFKGKALCQQSRPATQVHPSSATSICSRCVKIARINAGKTAVIPGGRETAMRKGLLATEGVGRGKMVANPRAKGKTFTYKRNRR